MFTDDILRLIGVNIHLLLICVSVVYPSWALLGSPIASQ